MKIQELATPLPGLAPQGMTDRRTLMQRGVGSCVYLFERLMPDPFVLVIVLTVLTVLGAIAFAPKSSPEVMLAGWYKGIFGIFTFAFQMVLILVTGHALASAS